MKVFKFGGASVKEAGAVRNVARILRQYAKEELMVIISAMGKTTNALEAILNSYIEGNESTLENQIQQLKDFHFGILNELYGGKDPEPVHQLEDLFIQFEWFFELGERDNYDFLYDQIVGFGEIFSTKIITTYLQKEGFPAKWIDARNFIITNENYREAAVDYRITNSLIERKLKPQLEDKLLVSQGFIGKNRSGHSTTLGREGSDFSAAVFAYALDAEELIIWKDVPGILNADPKQFSETVLFRRLSYSMATEMSYYGASVLHPKTIKPLQNKKIPLQVRSFVNSKQEGTHIGEFDTEPAGQAIIIKKQDQALIRLSNRDFEFVSEPNLSKIFNSLSRNRIKINLMRNSAISFSFSADYNPEKMAEFQAELQDEFEIQMKSGLELLSVRNYDSTDLTPLKGERTVLLEQRSGKIIQMVLEQA